GVVGGVGGGGGGAVLADGGVPRVGDPLVTREREGQLPAVDRGAAGVADGHVRDEAAGPLAGLGVGDVAGTAWRRAGRGRARGRRGGRRRGGVQAEEADGVRGHASLGQHVPGTRDAVRLNLHGAGAAVLAG